MISDAAVGHTLVDIIVADPTRRDLVERAARQDLVAATNAERRKEAHYRNPHQGRNLCPPLLRHTVHYLIGRMDFGSSVQL